MMNKEQAPELNEEFDKLSPEEQEELIKKMEEVLNELKEQKPT